MEMKQNRTFFRWTYSDLIPVLIGRKILEKFNDFYLYIKDCSKSEHKQVK